MCYGVLSKELFSYLYGIFITDGNLWLSTRNRGKITLEVNINDESLLLKMAELIPNSYVNYRVRDTNFKKQYKSVIFSNCNLWFRKIFIDSGFPIRDKTVLANTPQCEYSERDFWRGVIDGDGSIGFTNEGTPFVSLITTSDTLKQAFINLLYNKLGITKRVHRNKRDNAYNIIIKNEQAVKFSRWLYTDNDCLHLNRKYQDSVKISSWVRTKPHGNKGVPFDEYEINYILSHRVEDSIEHLNRSKKSICSKLYKLKLKNNFKANE